MVLGRNSSIRYSLQSRCEQKGCYRFLNNKKVTEQSLITELINRCKSLSNDRDLIVIQDTSSFNLNNHYYRLKKGSGLGTIEDNFNLGFFLHASLVIDAFSDTVLGCGDAQLWHRVYDDPKRASKTRKMPIEQKESYKWIKACQDIQLKFQQARSITFVEDRDGDIYEQFASVVNAKSHLVIRIGKDRKLADGGKLFSSLGQQPCCGKYVIDIAAERRKKRSSRKATVEVRYKKVLLKRPADNYNKTMAAEVQMNVVEAVEKEYEGKDKICWRLITSHEVNSFEDALHIINIYRKRWYIEQLFRLLKKQGFAMEETQLETGWAIRKLCVLGLNTVIRVMQLMQATEEEDASVVFTNEEQQCLQHLNIKYEGATDKLKNPHTPKSLLWSKWIIARMGGWKGYTSQRPPGPITLKRGLDSFMQIFIGWHLAKNVYVDVGTQ